MTQAEKGFTLREKKFAKTKIGLMHEFMSRLQTTPFSEIPIKEVCDKLEVSEGTFYNYFPHKVDLVSYFHKLTTLKITWEVDNSKEKLNNIEMIEHAFSAVADEIQEPFLFYEIVSLYASQHSKPDKRKDISAAEKIYAFPDYPGIEKIKVMALEDYFARIIRKAQQEKELSSDVPADDIVYSLIAILVGIPLAIDMGDFGKLKKLYKTQLSLLWRGLILKRRK